MKTKAIVLGALVAFSSAAFAQTGVASNSKFGHGEDSIQCVQNLSLMTQYSKQKDYKTAKEFWEKVYADCPASSKNIYVYGPRIVAWEINNEKDELKKEKLFDKLMKVYDDRIKYFGDDRKQGTNYILGRKVMDYITYVPAGRDPLKEKAFEWLDQLLDADGSSAEVSVYQNYFIVADGIFKKKPDEFREKYIQAYLKVAPLLAERAAAGGEGDSVFAQAKATVDVMFGASGAADCKTLDGIYASQVEAKKSDKEFLNMVLQLYGIADCQESNVYFKASAYKHKIEPSAGSARGLAVQAFKGKDYAKAIQYFKEACNLAPDNAEKSKLQLKIANIYKLQGNYQQARAAAQSAISYNAKCGAAYILIGSMYVESCKSISDDTVIQMTAFWAAVDKMEKAKAVDPSCAAEANKYINAYKNSFPPASELFMRDIKAGDKYTVPGWINESTSVRGK